MATRLITPGYRAFIRVDDRFYSMHAYRFRCRECVDKEDASVVRLEEQDVAGVYPPRGLFRRFWPGMRYLEAEFEGYWDVLDNPFFAAPRFEAGQFIDLKICPGFQAPFSAPEAQHTFESKRFLVSYAEVGSEVRGLTRYVISGCSSDYYKHPKEQTHRFSESELEELF